MSLTSVLRQARDRTVTLPLFRYAFPTGADFFFDLRKRLPNYTAKVVFDVGANFGQSTEVYLRRMPGASIYCFEPAYSTFKTLESNVGAHENVRCFQLALSSAKQVRTMSTEGRPDMYKLVDQQEDASQSNGSSTETVETETLSDFCENQGVSQISLLKIDTEGHELDVLRGAAPMLESQAVDFVEVEAGMSSTNTRHVPFEELKQLLESHGYYLFGIYEQVHEWIEKKPYLRRTNPVFISSKLANSN